MAATHPVIISSYRLPEWLSYLLPGEQFSRDIAATKYYRAWKEGVLAVFANDTYWGSLEDASRAVVKEQLAAIRHQVMTDSAHVHAATAKYTDVQGYFLHIASIVIGEACYLDIVGIDGNPLEAPTARALGQAYGRILLAQTPKGDLMFKLGEMMSCFRNAKPALNKDLKAWQTETRDDVWRVLEGDPADFAANVARVLSRCDHALHHVRENRAKLWPMEGRRRRLTLEELFYTLPTAATLLQTTVFKIFLPVSRFLAN
ncbi:hypothetical protein OF846_004537 [Rhodotorula toruloides]|nr:hypothetical protein OF846_004537 [Rhodotorula toruloides]